MRLRSPRSSRASIRVRSIRASASRRCPSRGSRRCSNCRRARVLSVVLRRRVGDRIRLFARQKYSRHLVRCTNRRDVGPTTGGSGARWSPPGSTRATSCTTRSRITSRRPGRWWNRRQRRSAARWSPPAPARPSCRCRRSPISGQTATWGRRRSCASFSRRRTRPEPTCRRSPRRWFPASHSRRLCAMRSPRAGSPGIRFTRRLTLAASPTKALRDRASLSMKA